MTRLRLGHQNKLLAIVAVSVLGGLTLFIFRTQAGLWLTGGKACAPTPNFAPWLTGTPSPVPPLATLVTSPGVVVTIDPRNLFYSNSTAYVITTTIDLAPTAPEDDKADVIVFRCDGTLVRYILPPAADASIVPLEPGDTILGGAPAPSMIGIHIPILTDTLQPPVAATSEVPDIPAVISLTPTLGSYPATNEDPTPEPGALATPAAYP